MDLVSHQMLNADYSPTVVLQPSSDVMMISGEERDDHSELVDCDICSEPVQSVLLPLSRLN